MGETALLRPEETNGYGAAGDPSVLRRRSTVASLAHDDGPDCLAGTRLGSFRNAVAKGVTAYSSPLNVLLVFVPLGFAAALFRLGASIIFLANFIGMIPLAMILGRATEDIGDRTNQTLGALLNVSLGNAVEIILSVSALRAGQLVLIQCTLIGSILSNLLLVLGSAFFVGGLAFKEQSILQAVSEANSDLLMFAVFGLAMPVAFSYAIVEKGAAKRVLEERFSLVVSVCMLLIYGLFMVFATVTHADQFENDGEEGAGGSAPGEDERSPATLPVAISVLVTVILLVAVSSELLIGAIDGFAKAWNVSSVFISVILLPVIGNAVEHMSAVLVAVHNKLDLAVGIACGSSVQIALFATPLLVLMSWVIPGERLTLVFSNFNVAALLLSVLVVNSTLADAKTNVLEGAVLVAAYAMLAAAYFLMG